MRKKILFSIFMIVILSLGMVSCSKNDSVETDSNSIEHSDSDFGSNGWHKYRIRNKD